MIPQKSTQRNSKYLCRYKNIRIAGRVQIRIIELIYSTQHGVNHANGLRRRIAWVSGYLPEWLVCVRVDSSHRCAGVVCVVAVVSEDYFKLASDLARAEGEATLRRIAAERKEHPCECMAYNFPHRQGGGKCSGPEPIRYTTDPRPAWEAEERRIFDAAEARAINSWAW